MELQNVEINHMINPVGYQFNDLTISCKLNQSQLPQSLEKRVVIRKGNEVVYQSDWEPGEKLTFHPIFQMTARTRYDVDVSLRVADRSITKNAFFETGLMTGFKRGHWIGSDDSSVHGLVIKKEISIPQGIQTARLYVSGLGLYEAYIDDQKVGEEFLAPGFTNYNYYTQIATHDITYQLQTAGQHTIKLVLADGWYRGKIGIKQHGGKADQYGNNLIGIAELYYTDQAGIEHHLESDASWKGTRSQITHSGIYYGEDFDATLDEAVVPLTTFEQPTKHVLDRLSLPIKAQETFEKPKRLLTPSGATVLDFGQNMAGWVTFDDRLLKGSKVTIEYGEALQNGELYRDNLRSARATFTYVSDGNERSVRPHFTYFGFRYVKLIDFPENLDQFHFKAQAIYSNTQAIGNIVTDNAKVNRLFQNVQWGQNSNFMDVPTDCPQRDERLGWTGDAAIFAKTASYNRDTFQFNRKFAFDIAVEQSLNQGKVPLYVPAIDETDGGKAVWGDAATIIPWTTYQRTGDSSVLRQNFGAMMSWVDWIHDAAKATSNEFLWLDSDQLGDWLALDTEDIMHLKGKTPDDLIASAYYYLSTTIVAKTAEVLGAKRERDFYQILAAKIREAFIQEFFTASGRLVTDTQTALALCLQLNLYPEGIGDVLSQKLVERIEKNQNHLTTGFVGTPALLPALSANHQHELAVQMFLSEDYPGWLYEVDHGATTIWERWNSVGSDNTIENNGMNSLNHYSSGAVMAWAYEYLVGIQADQSGLVIQPGITPKLNHVSGYTQLSTGKVAVDWQLTDDGHLVTVNLTIPFGYPATVNLPRTQTWQIGETVHQNGETLQPGQYVVTYRPQTPFVNQFDSHTPLNQFNENKALTAQLAEIVPFWGFLTLPGNMAHFEAYSLLQLSREMKGIGFPPLTKQQIDAINQIFTDYALQSSERNES